MATIQATLMSICPLHWNWVFLDRSCTEARSHWVVQEPVLRSSAAETAAETAAVKQVVLAAT